MFWHTQWMESQARLADRWKQCPLCTAEIFSSAELGLVLIRSLRVSSTQLKHLNAMLWLSTWMLIPTLGWPTSWWMSDGLMWVTSCGMVYTNHSRGCSSRWSLQICFHTMCISKYSMLPALKTLYGHQGKLVQAIPVGWENSNIHPKCFQLSCE
jgi:hypothetical protein